MGKLSDDLTMLTARLMMASNKGEILQLTNELSSCIGRLLAAENNAPTINEETVTWFLKFTEQEISKMSKTFRKEFKAEGCAAHVIKRPSGRTTFIYEIRYRRNGYNVSASSKDLNEAKRKFIEKLKTATPENKQAKMTVPRTFNEFAKYYFEHFRKRKVVSTTYEMDTYRLKKWILPFFENKIIKDITPSDCQTLLDTISKYGKTADEVYSLLNQIFKNAIAHGLIDRNPIALVFHIQHTRKHGTAFTKEEEKTLISLTLGTKFLRPVILSLFAGLRPNEIETARIEGAFIIAENSKRKGKVKGVVEYKKIPITPIIMPFIQYIHSCSIPPIKTVQTFISQHFPNHRMYDLRTTFYTRCKECGVADAARDEFVGHSLGALGNAYTDLSDEFLLQEGKKLTYFDFFNEIVPQNVPQNQK